MRQRCISPRAQAVTMLALTGGVGALIVAQLPEIRRYLAIRSM